MGVSNHLIGILNFLTALLSVPVIGAGIWLATKAHSTDCVRFLQWPVIAIGILMLALSVAGMCGAWCRVAWLLWVYVAVMLLLIVLLFCFTVFAFVVTNKGAGDAVSGKGFHEYHLGNYSTWLQRHLVGKASSWERIKSCLSDAKVCERLTLARYPTAADFAATDLTPLQSGCCKPPTACGYTFVTPTNWTATSTSSASADADCATWSNDASRLCFDCGSCKAGVLQNVKSDWRKVAIVNIIVLVFTIIVYSVACSALRNVRRDKYYGYV